MVLLHPSISNAGYSVHSTTTLYSISCTNFSWFLSWKIWGAKILFTPAPRIGMSGYSNFSGHHSQEIYRKLSFTINQECKFA